MFLNLFVFIITCSLSTALFCSNLTSINQKDTPCFLQAPRENPLVLHGTGHGLILPCHVARSKHSSVEWWYSDLQKLVKIKIYPVFPPVRPTVLRFVTGVTSLAKNSNETDILDASILLRNVNIDDSGTYRCLIRPWATDPFEQIENLLFNDDSNIGSLEYQVHFAGPRLCQSSPGLLPCFTAMRTSSPTVIDAYQTAFLQCVVKSPSRRVNVFWVVGDSSVNNVLITDFLTTNQYDGDRLRRVFPLSPFDHSIELSINRTTPERMYSCVIDGATDVETTIFTYIVRAIDFDASLNSTEVIVNLSKTDEEIHSLREDQKEEDKNKNSDEHSQESEKDDEEDQSQETSTSI